MKRVFFFVAISFVSLLSHATMDKYSLSMSLRVPRTYSNENSLGYRRYQCQFLKGDLYVAYGESGEQPTVTISNLVNTTHRIDGEKISYNTEVYESRWNLIGNNAKNQFITPSVVFSIEALPSYAIETGEDNSLILTLSGTGYTQLFNGKRIIRHLSGYAAGQLGCGCMAYGHISPTRVADESGASETVDDIASVFGSFTANWQKRISE